MDDTLLETIRTLLREQRLAVLATSAAGHPYTTLVAFAASGDLRHLLFATHRATRKFANLAHDHRVTLLVDNRTNRPEDFRRAAAATALGTAREVDAGERSALLEAFLTRHPYLKEFVSSPGCALFQVSVERYGLVQRFQEVVEVVLDDLPAP